MALGDGRNPFDYLIEDDKNPPAQVPEAPAVRYTAAEEFQDALNLEGTGHFAGGSAADFSSSQAYLEQLSVGGGAVEEVALECYSTADEYRDQFAVSGSGVVAEVETLGDYSPTDEFLEMLQKEPAERRRAARIQRVMAAGLVAPAPAPIVLIDVSLTGLRIGSSDPLEVEARVQIELPVQPPLLLGAEVRWCQRHISGNYEIGLHLLPMGAAENAVYREFVERPG